MKKMLLSACLMCFACMFSWGALATEQQAPGMYVTVEQPVDPGPAYAAPALGSPPAERTCCAPTLISFWTSVADRHIAIAAHVAAYGHVDTGDPSWHPRQ